MNPYRGPIDAPAQPDEVLSTGGRTVLVLGVVATAVFAATYPLLAVLCATTLVGVAIRALYGRWRARRNARLVIAWEQRLSAAKSRAR